jgi:hypothetical protein
MNTTTRRSDWIMIAGVALLGSVAAGSSAKGDIVELCLTGTWTADDFKVEDPPTPHVSADGTVFGVPPSDGSNSITLRVDTDDVFLTEGGWYGYSVVTLVAPPHTFGTASWEDSGILNLQGPGTATKAKLWTNTDISIEAPTRVYFRIFGTAPELRADIFFGGTQYLLWEYYAGEEIRSQTYYAELGGCISDADGDGIPDEEDCEPDSDLSPFVVIDGCDSGVVNVLFDDGCTMSDLIWFCAEDAINHDEFVSCVAQISNEWHQGGIISGQEKGAIQSCAAQADLP